MPVSISASGFGIPATVVSGGGIPVVGLRSIQLSAVTTPSDAPLGAVVGSLSVLNGVGSYTFTLASDASAQSSVSGATLKVAAALVAGSYPVTVHADNGSGSSLDAIFLITVTVSSAEFAWPDATNTGPRVAPTTIVAGGLVTTADGQVISGISTDGTIVILHDNVTIEDCEIAGPGNLLYGIDNSTNYHPGLTVKNTKITGAGTAIVGSGTFEYNDISLCENGVVFSKSYGSARLNYIHDLSYDSSATPHYDGIEINGDVSHIIVQFNTVINDNDQTSCVNINNNFVFPVSTHETK